MKIINLVAARQQRGAYRNLLLSVAGGNASVGDVMSPPAAWRREIARGGSSNVGEYTMKLYTWWGQRHKLKPLGWLWLVTY